MNKTTIARLDTDLEQTAYDKMTSKGHVIVAHALDDYYIAQLRTCASDCLSALLRITKQPEIYFDGECSYRTLKIEIYNILPGVRVINPHINTFYAQFREIETCDCGEDCECEEEISDCDCGEDCECEEDSEWELRFPVGVRKITYNKLLELNAESKDSPELVSLYYHSVDDILENLALNIDRLQPASFGDEFYSFLGNCLRIFDFSRFVTPDTFKFYGNLEQHKVKAKPFSKLDYSKFGNEWLSNFRTVKTKVKAYLDSVHFNYDPSEVCHGANYETSSYVSTVSSSILPAIYSANSNHSLVKWCLKNKYAIIILDDDNWLFVSANLTGFGYDSDNSTNLLEFDLHGGVNSFKNSVLIRTSF
tara:strand:+ start:3326 stop:4414 length:1089 start_codon:yes stop_codon:yes gene_type:complete